MSTLPNVNTREVGKFLFYVGFTSNVSPKIQSLYTENFHIGVSLGFMFERKIEKSVIWINLRSYSSIIVF